jgi:hypothetical protein
MERAPHFHLWLVPKKNEGELRGVAYLAQQPPLNGQQFSAPFGGVKNSGYGKFGGTAVIESFTAQRWVTIQYSGPHLSVLGRAPPLNIVNLDLSGSAPSTCLRSPRARLPARPSRAVR